VLASLGMSTVAEIVEAVERLSPAEQCELVMRLEPVLLGDQNNSSSKSGDYRSPEFAALLADHFHRAKRAVLAGAAAH
jgi:hypothetical protein